MLMAFLPCELLQAFLERKLKIDDNVNDLCAWQVRPFLAELGQMNPTTTKTDPLPAAPATREELAPITAMMSSRLMVLANLLRRGAILRYKRLTGLSSVEFALVASLGRRPPMSVARLAEAVGMDKGQISRALASLVSRKLVSRAANPKDSREVLVRLTRSGLAAHDAIVAGALERSACLLEGLSADEVAMLLFYIDRLTERAASMLAAEREMR
jgi:DNA-binding MarR family transcriptional regulator